MNLGVIQKVHLSESGIFLYLHPWGDTIHVKLYPFFFPTPLSSVSISKKSKTMTRNKSMFFYVYGCLTISHYIKRGWKVQTF